MSDGDLERFACESNVNRYTKKLEGALVFKLLIYCIVTEKDTSLRGMQSALESALFQSLHASGTPDSIAHSSISDRLSQISVDFFEKIFRKCVQYYQQAPASNVGQIVRFDSTIVSLSTKLLNVGYHIKGGDADKLRLLKFTIGLSEIAECVCLFTANRYTSENAALTETILANQALLNERIAVFDRGITARAKYDLFTENQIQFISRINPDTKRKEHIPNKLKKAIETPTLTILSDCWAYLYQSDSKLTSHPVRLIHATKKSDGAAICFITNIDNIKQREITEIYKSRWEIEVFFKFIKQHLNFSHLIKRSENGIKVIMYATMIATILVEYYKKQYKIKGFKIARKKFAQQLERDIIFQIVLACGGDPKQAEKVLYRNTS